MTKADERNLKVREFVNTRVGLAKTKGPEDFQEYDETSEIHKLLTDLIEVKSRGFRGVVVTAIAGLHLDETFDPRNNFYSCHPRSIFEKGIWYALQDNGIPCGKSDPLNVAKNVSQLNEDWAQGRRPQDAALAVVRFLRVLMNSGKTERARLVDYFFYRLWKYAQGIANYTVAEIEASNDTRQTIGSKLVDFTLAYPESGHLPQYLVAQLLSGLFRLSKIEVVGGDESVFGTNTTSKKPADIWFEIDGSEINLYEVTVKPVSRKRLDDSLSALESTGHLNHSVTFICRIEHDVRELDVVDGSFEYNGKRFDFIDYRVFCLSLCALLSDEEFATVLDNVSTLIKSNDISMKTKRAWNDRFGKDT